TAIGKDGPVVLAYGQGGLSNGNHTYLSTDLGDNNRPLDKFVCGNPKAVAGCKPVAELGATAVVLDNDKVVRRMPMFVQAPCVFDGGGTCAPANLNPLGFLAYRRLVLGPDSTGQADLQYAAEGATFGTAWSKPLPVDDFGVATIGWSGGPGYVKKGGQYLSFWDVYNNNFDRGKVDGKIVLIGIYGATAIHDEQLVAPAGANNDHVMNGIEIHANLIQMLNSPGQVKFVQPEPPVAVLLSILLICLLLGIVLPRLSAVFGLAATIGTAVVYTVAWIPASTILRVVPDFFHVWLAIGFTYAGLMAYRFLYEEREKRKVTTLFGQYLKPELVESMARKRSVEDVEVGGTRKELSLLFVDIRGFTHMSESMEPQDVLRVIDRYLDELTKVVFKWDGTLDKYVGDEIMAFWNAPHDHDNHALLALRCAWEMIARMPELNAALRADGLPEIKYGIGINTGPATIGIMGPERRRTYTALGDTVNTAARFCGHAGPTQILVGQTTYEECRDYVAVDLVPGVQLKGKSAEKFTIYRVTAIREEPGQPWATAPGLETYSEVGVYHQETMIGAGATVSMQTGGPTAGHTLLDTAEFQLPPEPAAPVG
ncbi:MAG: adenylate/guanylate cyclase domain-containing protein, partial [Candidatus Dormibacter sp.]